ncbi:MAG: N-acetyl-gamma-glutamyl-phosphate reductase [Ruminococcaceae bacterium]|nr:N-acetyl-gamma-glutamyl-phosphate reductase [Oscillospiraceae bacterium]
MIKVGIIGATGYAGAELVRILTYHPETEIVHAMSKSYAGQKLTELYPSLCKVRDLVCEDLDTEVLKRDCDVVFTALPHGASAETIASLMESPTLKVIDLSADFRYRDAEIYSQWYGIDHCAKDLLQESVYGLCELYREDIKKARLIGNPGCYTTCSILGAAPLLAKGLIEADSVIIDAKSGVSGAGRKLVIDQHFCECTENTKAYGVAKHRHTSEIEQELSLLAREDVVLSFTPHLIPQKRGILATIYGKLKTPMSTAELLEVYREFYKDEYFIRIYEEGKLPETNHVAGSNFVDMGLVSDPRTGRVIVVSCIDNLFKGAAGQAVQNMNLLFGLPETTALDCPAFYL